MSKKTLKLTRMAEIEEQEVKWLWYPYIPFGKITIIHGDPGEGKTTFALRLASACSTGTPLPGMDYVEPFNVIYQTAEDGLADTIKPRLKDAGANQLKVININEDDCPLTLLDERIEEAIKLTEAKLIILDPIQGYDGDGNLIDTIGNPVGCPNFKDLTYSQAIECYHYPKKLSAE